MTTELRSMLEQIATTKDFKSQQGGGDTYMYNIETRLAAALPLALLEVAKAIELIEVKDLSIDFSMVEDSIKEVASAIKATS